MDTEAITIVGASLAGAKAAETLRAEGFEGRIFLIGSEPDRPYERPPLSKEYLRGEVGREKVYVHDERYYTDNNIDLILSTSVEAIDLERKLAVTDSAGEIPFDKLLLCTGAEPRRLPIPGGTGLDGVIYLRSVADSDRLREAIMQASKVAVVGAGWIGSEVAASARQMGVDVALIEVDDVPLKRVLGAFDWSLNRNFVHAASVGRVFKDLHADHGVELHFGTSVTSIEGTQTVSAVRLNDNSVVECDLVVVGIGVMPRTDLAKMAGLSLENGILVDAGLRTNHADIFAAGDVANAWHPLFDARIRIEHWANALHQGPAAARSMLGHDVTFDRVPYFFSDQYELGMEYSGYASPIDPVVFRGNPDQREFIAFWLRNDVVMAGMNVNVWDVVEPIQHLIRRQTPVDVARLTNPDIPLDEV